MEDVRRPLTLLLMGRAGNGKSATGNSILGKKVFESRKSSSGITKISSLQTCVRKDGQVIKVIDTPGMFDLSSERESTAREIMKCKELASEGIHAVILVFSVRNRFSREEEVTIEVLQNTFGFKVMDNTIVILTGGDELDDEEGIEDYLSHKCPVALKNILAACKNRYVVFDNKTNDEAKKDEQVDELLDLVMEILDQNGGQPYKPLWISNTEFKEELERKHENFCTEEIYSDPKLDEMLNEATDMFQRKLEEEREARRRVEEKKEEMQKQYDEKIEKINEVPRTSLQRPTSPKVQQNPEHHNICKRLIRYPINLFQSFRKRNT